MSIYSDRFSELTVEQVREINEASKWYCSHEVTCVGGDNE